MRSNPSRSPVARHHAATIALHWSSLVAILLGLLAVFGREFSDDKALRAVLLEVHRNAGLLIFTAALVRAVIRSALGFGDVNDSLTRRQRLLSSANQFVLYALLLATPLVGWLLTNAHGQTPLLLGFTPLPELIGRDRGVADRLLEAHETLSWLLLAFSAAHASAALWHHYRLRDGVLRSMLPTGPRRAVPRPRRQAFAPR